MALICTYSRCNPSMLKVWYAENHFLPTEWSDLKQMLFSQKMIVFCPFNVLFAHDIN